MDDNNLNALGIQNVAEESFNTDVENEATDSFNDNSDNSTNVETDVETEIETDVEIEDSFNDNSVENEAEDSFNTDNSVENEAEDSFNDNSVETEVEVEVEIEDSFNDNSDNSINTEFETEIEDSYNAEWDSSVRNQDSFNITSSFNTQTLNDHSTTIGVRQYNAGFGDLNLGGLFGGAGAAGAAKGAWGHGGGGGAGDVEIDNRSLQVDQSVNQMVSETGPGDVNQIFGQNATIAFGDDSIAAGDDVEIDNSQMHLNLGDINIGNTDIDTRINDSFNDFSQNYEMEVELEYEDSFNDESVNTDLEVEIEDSFTSEIDSTFENSYEWENSGNLFSPGAATTGGEAETDIEF